MGSRLGHLHLADGSGSTKDEHLVPGRVASPVPKFWNCWRATDIMDRSWSRFPPEGSIAVNAKSTWPRLYPLPAYIWPRPLI